jgi:hypothetical protein
MGSSTSGEGGGTSLRLWAAVPVRRWERLFIRAGFKTDKKKWVVGSWESGKR